MRFIFLIEDEPATGGDDSGLGLGMPKIFWMEEMRLWEEEEKRGRRMSTKKLENKQVSILNKSDHNVNPEKSEDDTSDDGPENKIWKVSQTLTIVEPMMRKCWVYYKGWKTYPHQHCLIWHQTLENLCDIYEIDQSR